MNKLKLIIYLALVVGLLLLLKFKEKNYYRIPSYNTATTFNAVVEIPAGTNKKTEYHPHSNKFTNVNDLGNKRIIDFLPYPVNYGFIPSTLMDTIRGGDGDALDIVIIAESLPMKTVIEVYPIGILKLIDSGEIDDKIIAIPVNEELQIIEAKKLSDLEQNYPEIQKILIAWFTNYKGNNIMKYVGWEDEKSAVKVINKWKID